MFPHMTEFLITDWARLFTDTMGIFKQCTSIRFCTHFHAIGELLYPLDVLNLNQFIVRFNEFVLHTIGWMKMFKYYSLSNV